LNDLDAGRLPAPHKLLDGPATINNSPFALRYGRSDSLTPAAGPNSYALILGDAGADRLNLTFNPSKPPMAVGGKGETGLKTPTDMYYFSLTRCAVSGTIDTGHGPEPVASGQGWFDHQWGTSWVADNDGWDWWGVQLDNGEDILFYRQRDLSTGRVFSPSATFMDVQGVQTATSNVIFTPDPTWVWRNPSDGTLFPLGWTISFPGKSLTLHIYAAVEHQAIPTLGPGGGIWEGSCRVAGTEKGSAVDGVAYMELVGYDSPGAKAWAEHLQRTGYGEK
jgi:predicted secreted hydrolase